MAIAVAISPGILILLLYLQNIFAQQCLNNVGFKNSPVFPQQNFQKSSCELNQIAQNGLNFNSPQQESMQQVNYPRQSNIQAAPLTQQASNQPQMNLQQGNSQQPGNLMSNSPLLKQPNQDLTANIFSALYNIKQSSQNQRDTRNIVKGNTPQQMNYEQLSPSQNQYISISTPTNEPQSPSMSNSQFPPSFTFKFVPSSNVPLQPNQEMFALPVHKISTNDQSKSYIIQNQPVTNSVTRQQETVIQSPMVIPNTQTNTAQNQPMVLSFQPSQVPSLKNQPTLQTSQISQNQPIIYTVQTQPSTVSRQNQQISGVPSQYQIINNPSMDKQSLMSYVMSQMQNPQGSNNMLASILPGIMNTKSEKSSSMKTLLPLIINMLNEKKSCCGCPHCGCNNSNNNDKNKPEPLINTGYSNQINYSQQNPENVLAKMTEYMNKSVDSSSGDAKQEKLNVEPKNTSTEISEEEESDEEYDEE